MRVAAEALEHRLGDRLEQLLMGQHELARLLLIIGFRPIIPRRKQPIPLLRYVERTPTPHPTLDKVGMDVAGLLDREISLVDRSVPFRAKAHLFCERGRREQIERQLFHLIVEPRIDPVAGEDGKTDLLQRRRESLGEARLLSGVATKELAKVEGR